MFILKELRVVFLDNRSQLLILKGLQGGNGGFFLRIRFGCWLTWVRMAVAAEHTALAAIGKRERIQERTVLGAIGDMEVSREEDLGFLGESRGGEAQS